MYPYDSLAKVREFEFWLMDEEINRDMRNMYKREPPKEQQQLMLVVDLRDGSVKYVRQEPSKD